MFRRQIEVIGKKNQEILKEKSVLIVGCGGLGNIIATTLSCIGLKKIYLIDFDRIEIHNIPRQFHFSKDDIGKCKCEVLKKKITRCESEIVTFFKRFSVELNVEVDLIMDATDNFETRIEIDRFAKIKKIPWIYASVEEWKAQIGVFKKTDFNIFSTKKYTPKGQISPMVNLAGSFASLVGFKTLLNMQDEALFYLDFENGYQIKEFSF